MVEIVSQTPVCGYSRKICDNVLTSLTTLTFLIIFPKIFDAFFCTFRKPLLVSNFPEDKLASPASFYSLRTQAYVPGAANQNSAGIIPALNSWANY
jgi:hypothetical protein